MLQDQLQQEVHVWLARPDHATDPARLDQYRSILCAEETTRYRRFHFPTDSHHYLIAHALLRHSLSKYADIAPADWTFSQGEHGRPEISNPGMAALRFNLTHTAGLVGCVVSLDNDCGIDAEFISSRHNAAGVAERMFSARECHELEQLGGNAQLDYFFARWTLREAYVKARGIGISFPTRKLHFRIDDGMRVEVMFEKDLRESECEWRFHLLRPTPEHVAAIALHSGRRAEKKLRVQTVEL